MKQSESLKSRRVMQMCGHFHKGLVKIGEEMGEQGGGRRGGKTKSFSNKFESLGDDETDEQNLNFLRGIKKKQKRRVDRRGQ